MIFSNLDSWKSVMQQAKDNSKHLSNMGVNTAKTFEQNSRQLTAAAANSSASVSTSTPSSSSSADYSTTTTAKKQ
jgi:hypothetical protein